MRIALISDLHANLEAVTAVLGDMETRGISEILCAGDLVNYGPNPGEVVDLLRSRGIPSVMGNHDSALGEDLPTSRIRVGPGRDPQVEIESYQWTAARLPAAGKAFLARLPRLIRKRYGDLTLVLFHGTPSSLTEYLSYEVGDDRWTRLAGDLRTEVAVFGHTHLPFNRRVNSTLFCNPGSVGRPVDGDPRAAYGVVTTGPRPSFEVVRVFYNVGETARKTRAWGLPEALAAGLEQARGV